jgi:class 3 adenylate cyclase
VSPLPGSPGVGAILPAPPGPDSLEPKRLIGVGGSDAGRTFAFCRELEIGRLRHGAPPETERLLIADRTVSSKHCVISQDADGRCFVRDLSLNGTWIEGRRLVPGTEVELKPGQEISVGQGHVFRLEGRAAESAPVRDLPEARAGSQGATDAIPPLIEATIVIGDVQGYTGLVREAPPDVVQASMNALFESLEATAAESGGTVKEYPGDAMLAYWESGGAGNSAARACRAALALHEAARRLARDPSVWMLPGSPLRMDWALVTGPVTARRLGGSHPLGLSLVGEPVVKAYRLEKIADEETGPIVVCSKTYELAGGAFRFRDLGERALEGFPQPERVYALTGSL